MGIKMKEAGLVLAIVMLALAGCGEPVRNVQQTAADQALILACLHLDVPAVRKQISAGADVNARFGTAGTTMDLCDSHGGHPMDGDAWTPLIALASADLHPSVIIGDGGDGIIRSRVAAKDIDLREFAAWTGASVEIFALLKAHDCDINAADHHGATALYASCYSRNLPLSLALIAAKAKVNTRVGLYIDGSYDDTPLHRALWSSVLVEALLKAGARKSARDSEWNRPIDWVNTVNPTEDEVKVRKLLGGWTSYLPWN